MPIRTDTFYGSGAGLTGIPQSAVTSLTSDLALKAPLASPTFTGTVTAPTLSGSTATFTGIVRTGNTLQIGGSSASEVAWVRSGTDIRARLANDSEYTNIDVLGVKLSGTSLFATANTWTANQRIDAGLGVGTAPEAGSVFDGLGASNPFARIKATAGNVNLFLDAATSNTPSLKFRQGGLAKGEVQWTNGTGVGVISGTSAWYFRESTRMLGFGVTASDPALKPSGTTLQVRLADDSGFAQLTASAVAISGAYLALNSSGTPGAANYSLYTDSSTTWLNAPSAGTFALAINNVAIARGSTTGLVLGSSVGTTSPASLLDLFGSATQTFSANSSTSTKRTQGEITAAWISSTDASRTARLTMSVYDTAAREFLRADATGSAASVMGTGNWTFVPVSNRTFNVTSVGGNAAVTVKNADLSIYTNFSIDAAQIDLSTSGSSRIRVVAAGLQLTTASTYADNAAAVTGGLATNTVYKTATGELRIVV